MDEYQAIHTFWSSFGIPAYDEGTIPTGDDRPSLPYITYDISVSDFGTQVAMSASIWYLGTSWTQITAKLKEVEAEIGRGGKMVPFDGGSIWIKKGTPFAQRVPDDNDMIRRIFMNIVAEYVTA